MFKIARLSGLVAFLTLSAAVLAPTAAARPGDLDPDFGVGGKTVITPASGGMEIPADMAMTPDGGYVVAGADRHAGKSLVVRFDADGNLDTDFGDQGELRTAGNGWQQVEVTADGHIVLAGGNNSQMVFERLNADGTPDAGFGGDGGVALDVSSLTLPDGATRKAAVSAMRILGDGSIRAIGTGFDCTGEWTDSSCPGALLLGVDQDGSLAAGLGTGGVKDLGIRGWLDAASIFADGSALVIRSHYCDPQYGGALTTNTVSASGIVGPDVNLTGGEYSYYCPDLSSPRRAATIDAQGRVLFVTGQSLWRLDPDGTPDAGFGDQGEAPINDSARFVAGHPYLKTTGITTDDQGRILLSGGLEDGGKGEGGGDTWASMGAVARLTGEGIVDNSFGDGGVRIVWPGRRAYRKLTSQTPVLTSDDRIVIAGLGPAGEDYGFTLAGLENSEATMPVCAGKTADYLGTPGIDKIQAFDAVVFTGGGDDRIIGGSGATICAGEGDDTAALEFGPSRVFGGSGDDTIRLSKGRNEASGGGGDDLIIGGHQQDLIKGEAGKDRLYGGGRDDRLFGGPGQDQIFGQGGRDWLFGGGGQDLLRVGPVRPDPTDYVPAQIGGFMRVTTLGRKASTFVRLPMICEGRDPAPASQLTMRSIAFDPGTGLLSNVGEGSTSLDDDFVWISEIQARVKGDRITGRVRYIEGENYYDQYVCRTGSGPMKESSILKDAWVPFTAKAKPKPRQVARQN